MGISSKHLVTRSVRSEVFYVRVKETLRRESHSRGELGFSIIGREKDKFFLFTSLLISS